MTIVSTEDPQFQAAIEACAVALKRMADYELDATLSQRMHELGERKEYLPSFACSAPSRAEGLGGGEASCVGGPRSGGSKPPLTQSSVNLVSEDQD